MTLLGSVWTRLPRLPSRFKASDDESKIGPLTATLERLLTARHVLYVTVAFWAWLSDALNFWLPTLYAHQLSTQFGISTTEELTSDITFTLLARSAGALFFGLLADRFGRRWLFTLNMLAVGGTTLATAFIQTYEGFLAIRCAFAFTMGGTYGMAVACALENLPAHTRGFVSGFLTQAQFWGYFFAVSIVKMVVVPSNSWTVAFYVGSGISFFVALLCLICPDSEIFIQARRHTRLHPESARPSLGQIFSRSLRLAVTKHWKRFIYCIILLTVYHFLSHVSRDLYQKFAKDNRGMTAEQAGFLIMIGAGGSCVGAITGGTLSQFLGRKITMIVMCLIAASFVPLWILPTTFLGLAFGIFWFQFGLQGSWGVLPIYISEISPPGCLATFVGLTYNLGDLFSSFSPILEIQAAELIESLENDAEIHDFGLTQAVLYGISGGLVVFLLLFGHERHGLPLRSVGVEYSTSDLIYNEQSPT